MTITTRNDNNNNDIDNKYMCITHVRMYVYTLIEILYVYVNQFFILLAIYFILIPL